MAWQGSRTFHPGLDERGQGSDKPQRLKVEACFAQASGSVSSDGPI